MSILVVAEHDGKTISGVPEEDSDRTNAAGKASSVQFIHFPFTDAQAAAFREPGADVVLALAHPDYRHMVGLTDDIRAALGSDLD